ncbi:3-isopropylmalate dehydratase small subunit [Pigmentiphaga soli]|uniref:3-isopropylmalate dehydratase n=1 Tax=Pigmentiphaga soli TaxID=1007095 RepID=A0ABP8GP38_9BURK
MEPFVRLESGACALPQINIDTDQLLPARFMKQPRQPGAGYDRFLFHDLRRRPDGSLDPAFPLNDPRNAGARIVVARRNFGSGSSREAAVYALVDAGVRCVIAPSHGDIFASNAVNNGLLPARLGESETEELLALLAPGGVRAEVDLQACAIRAAGRSFAFAIDPVWRVRLLNGWDDIDMTRRFADGIARWVAADRIARPWAQQMPEAAP